MAEWQEYGVHGTEWPEYMIMGMKWKIINDHKQTNMNKKHPRSWQILCRGQNTTTSGNQHLGDWFSPIHNFRHLFTCTEKHTRRQRGLMGSDIFCWPSLHQIQILLFDVTSCQSFFFLVFYSNKPSKPAPGFQHGFVSTRHTYSYEPTFIVSIVATITK